MQMYHVGDIGTRFDYEIRDEDGELIDLETVEEIFIRFRRPDRTTFDVTAELGEDSIASYTFEDEFDQAGIWRHEYRVNMPDGNGWWSKKAWFRVYDHIPANAGS